jgi:chemotaxis response regulator CheB
VAVTAFVLDSAESWGPLARAGADAFPVVAVAASGDGVPALTRLFAAFPPSSPARCWSSST